MFYRDLSKYEYSPETIPPGVAALNVGWLEHGHKYQRRRDLDARTAAALFDLCADHRAATTRGFHLCSLCDAGMRKEHAGEWGLGVTASLGGRAITTGSSEVRVLRVDGVWLCAPDMIIHYVLVHGYQPPPDFESAVRERRWVLTG